MEPLSSEIVSDDESQVVQGDVAKPALGILFKKAREKQGLSLEDAAGRLRLSIKQINALEQDDFHVFASPMLVKGFIKSYAKLLGMAVEPLLESYRLIAPPQVNQSISYQPASGVISQSAHNPLRIFLWLAGLLLIVLMIWVGYGKIQKDSATIAPESSAVEPFSPEVALPAAERTNENDAKQLTAEIQLPPATPEAPVPAETAKVEPKASTGAAPENTANNNLLDVKLVATESSWIDVKDGTGKTIFTKLVKPSADEHVQGMPPLKFHIGNAKGIQVFMNGQNVDLTSSTYNNIVRITLGAE